MVAIASSASETLIAQSPRVVHTGASSSEYRGSPRRVLRGRVGPQVVSGSGTYALIFHTGISIYGRSPESRFRERHGPGAVRGSKTRFKTYASLYMGSSAPRRG